MNVLAYNALEAVVRGAVEEFGVQETKKLSVFSNWRLKQISRLKAEETSEAA